MLSHIRAFIRYIRIKIILSKKYITYNGWVYVGKNSRLWAPHHIRLGHCVRIANLVHIEANCTIGDYSGLSSRVALVGRLDHNYKTIGVPFNFAPFVGSRCMQGSYHHEKDEVTIEEDVWVGHQSIILTGVRIRRGTIVAAGSVVIHDTEPYSIVAGVPAKKVGDRFTKEEIETHERMIAGGIYKHSLRGYDYDVCQPGGK